jgi:heme exporter protein C
MESNIFRAMMLMTFGFWMYSFAAVFMRVRGIILSREAESAWVRALVEAKA